MMKQFVRSMMFELSYFILDKVKSKLQEIELGENVNNKPLSDVTLAVNSKDKFENCLSSARCGFATNLDLLLVEDVISLEEANNVLSKFKLK